MPTNEEVQDISDLKSDVASMRLDMTEVKTSINQIAAALTKLAVLEDRQSNQTALVTKTLERLETLEDKQHATELRFAAGVMSLDRIAGLERIVHDISNRLIGYEASGRTLGGGVKVIWAVVGAAVTAAVATFLARGGAV